MSPAKVINWLTVTKSKFPVPSVFKNWPAVPSPSGKTKVLLPVTALGALKPIKFVPLLVPSLNLISPPAVSELPILIVSIAKLASAVSAELPVRVPLTWSNIFVKYSPPITDTLFASPFPSTPPSPIKILSPRLPWVPVP